MQIPEFLQNLDYDKSPVRILPPPPRGAVSSDNLQKRQYDPENHNIAGNYDGKTVNFCTKYFGAKWFIFIVLSILL